MSRMVDAHVGRRLRIAAIILAAIAIFIPFAIAWKMYKQQVALKLELETIRNETLTEVSRDLERVGGVTADLRQTVSAVRDKIGLGEKPKEILFGGLGFLFNSWENIEGDQSRFISASGAEQGLFTWVVQDNGRTGSFTYDTNQMATTTGLESSGGYVTFYLEPIDRLRYRSLRFRCRATGSAGQPDVGLRCVVDDPARRGDRELAVYEYNSLSRQTPIAESWNSYDVPLSEFESIKNRTRPPFPRGLDLQTINKIVFFVDTEKAKACSKATLWFSDLVFIPLQD